MTSGETLALVIEGIFGIFGFFIMFYIRGVRDDVKELYTLYGKINQSFQDYRVEIASGHYPKPEVDGKIEALKIHLDERLDELKVFFGDRRGGRQ